MAITPTNFILTYNRLNDVPIDASSIFDTTQERVDYLKKDFAGDGGFAAPDTTYPGSTSKYHGMIVFDKELNKVYSLKKSTVEPDVEPDEKVEIRFALDSTPLNSSEYFWLYWQEVASTGPGDIKLSDLYYFNDTPMPQAVGGIPAGTTFDGGLNSLQPSDPVLGVDMETLTTQLLYPYIAPSWNNLDDNRNSVFQIGTKVAAPYILDFDVSGTSEDIIPASGNINISGPELILTSGNGGTSEDFSFSADYPTTGNKSVTITGTLNSDYGADRDRFLTALDRRNGGASTVAWAYDGVQFPTFNAVTSSRINRTWALTGQYQKDRISDPGPTQNLPTRSTSFNIMPRFYRGIIPSTLLPAPSTLISEVDYIRKNHAYIGAPNPDSVIGPSGLLGDYFDIVSYLKEQGSTLNEFLQASTLSDNPSGTWNLAADFGSNVDGRRIVVVPKIYGIPGAYNYISTSGATSSFAMLRLRSLIQISASSTDASASPGDNLDYIVVLSQNITTVGSIKI